MAQPLRREKDLGATTSHFINDASEMAGEFLDNANVWVRNNYGKTIGVVAALTAVGLLGYYLGRREFSEQESLRSRE